MIPRKAFLPFLIAAHAFVALGALLVLIAYSSRDTSGIQYIFLWLAAMPAGIGLLIYVAGAGMVRLPWLGILFPAAVLVLAFLPQLSGAGYNGTLLDTLGSAAAFLLLAAQLIAVWRSVQESRRAAPNEELKPTATPSSLVE
jgi:hypothetical protein